MNIITFTYTKTDGSKSKRVLSPLVNPNKMYEGTDLSELSIEDQVDYVQALGTLHDEYLAKVSDLNVIFDVNHRFRRFDHSQMTDVVNEVL